MVSDFLNGFLTSATMVYFIVAGYLLGKFIFGAERMQELKEYYKLRFCMVMLGCGMLSLLILVTVILPVIMIASGEPLSELPTMLAVALMYLAFFLALILLWKYIVYRRNKDKECGFWKKVGMDLKGMFSRKEKTQEAGLPWRCPNCMQENEGAEPFCIHCHTKRPEKKQ